MDGKNGHANTISMMVRRKLDHFTSSNTLDSFRVLSTHSLPKTVSVELEGKIFAPLADVQGNIRRLVAIHSKTLVASL